MDIGITWDTAKARGDWTVTSGDLAIDLGGLRTATLLSLFTDKRASNDNTPPTGSPPDLHGYWGDTYDGFQIGSLLWTLNRAVISNVSQFLSQAKDYCLDALQWLVTAGIVATITVTTQMLAPTILGIGVVLIEPSGTRTDVDANWAWQGA